MADEVHQFSDLPRRKGDAQPMGAALANAQSNRSSGSPPRIGVIYNKRSHRSREVAPEVAARPNVTAAEPATRDDIPAALAQFAKDGIDLLIIAGGDGTVRDVLTSGEAVFGDHWPDVAVLPKGKTNALNVDLGAPDDWSVIAAIDAYETGTRKVRHPVAIRAIDGSTSPVLGFILGAGAFSLGIRAGQDAHRYGAFDSLAVGLTSVWGIAQALFGSDTNPWRRGVKMQLETGEDRTPVPHSYSEGADRREILLASTLEKFPVGVKPFHKNQTGLRVAVLDRPRRRVVAMLPGVLAGYTPDWLARYGFHQFAVPSFRMKIEDEFIVDGEFFPAGDYLVSQGPALNFLVP